MGYCIYEVRVRAGKPNPPHSIRGVISHVNAQTSGMDIIVLV